VKILLLEDDKLFCETLVDFLQECEYSVDIASNGQLALNKTFEKKYDLYIFDINVPKIDGLEVLNLLRQNNDNTPTIFLTSYKDQQTLIQGFQNGADDYIKKPVDLDELSLRIKSILKRSGKNNNKIELFKNVFYIAQNQQLIIDNKINILPVKVNLLLELFIQNRSGLGIIKKEQIIQALWNADESYSEGSIRVYINHIKKLLPNINIKNIKGVGYQIQF
jgi:DNA-binding response OmpR family regulator